MVYQLDATIPAFPDPNLADEEDGLLAIGGKMEPEWLLSGYYAGCFPWFQQDGEYYWFSPDPRMVVFPDEYRPHKSLARVIKSGKFEVRMDTCFEEVMRHCASTPREDQDGTWINESYIYGYGKLYRHGYAHSFETFYQDELVGGLYGVCIGRTFYGESMFHTMTDASKVAFARMIEVCRCMGITIIDAQQETSYLTSLGGRLIPRKEFLDHIHRLSPAQAIEYSRNHTKIPNQAVLLLGGNEGDSKELLRTACHLIDQHIGPIARRSSLYQTEPWGDFGEENPQPFLNQGVVANTCLDAATVMAKALEIEKELGRLRTEKDTAEKRVYSSRPIDIDLIFYNDTVCDTSDLILPHPRLHLRRFVLEPLNEIIPNYIHPVLLKSVRELTRHCPDNSAIEKL